MAGQAQVAKPKSERRSEEPGTATAKAPNTDALKEDLDGLLDEIDSVLEENAEEFVDGYVQKGGE